jgi:hypothetical protein
MELRGFLRIQKNLISHKDVTLLFVNKHYLFKLAKYLTYVIFKDLIINIVILILCNIKY